MSEDNPKRKRAPKIASRIVSYFVKRPGQVITVQDLTKYLKATEIQVRDSINSVRYYRRNDPSHVTQRIETVIRGQSWRYVPEGYQPGDHDPTPVTATPKKPSPAATSKRMFEEVGPIRNGFVVVDEDDQLYRVEKL